MAGEIIKTPYDSAMAFAPNSTGASWASDYDRIRLTAYDLYDDFYNNTTATFQLLLRGQNEKPVLVPTAKRLVNTIARYVGKGWGYTINSSGEPDEDGVTASEEQIILAQKTLGEFFKRERVLSKFVSGKKEWLRRGDWVWMLSADPDKPEGRRISIDNVDPRTYFPISDEKNPTRLAGAMIIEEYIPEDSQDVALKVQRWLKPNHPEYDEGWAGNIAYESTIFKMEDWDDPDKAIILEQLVPLGPLPGISAIPLYHLRDNEESGDPFGRSNLSGLESIIASVNQAASDEDLSLAMAGLGQYVTNSGRPIDDNNEEVDWILGPGRIIEVGDGKTFTRVKGLETVKPFQEHIEYLESALHSVLGISDVALGTAGAAESGIALVLRLAPLLDAADEKDLVINDVMGNLLYDLKSWFKVYEGWDFLSVEVSSFIDKSERIPFDREAYMAELAGLYAAGVITLEYYQAQLVERCGYEFPPSMLEDTKADVAEKARLADPYASRAAAELSADDDADTEE